MLLPGQADPGVPELPDDLLVEATHLGPGRHGRVLHHDDRTAGAYQVDLAEIAAYL